MRQQNIKALRIPFLIILALNMFIITYSQSIEISYDSLHSRQLGGTFPLGITLTEKNGKIKQTKGFLQGRQNWSRYNINVLGGTFKNGMVTITNDPKSIINHNIIVIVNLFNKPEVAAKIDIMLTYKELTVADFTSSTNSTSFLGEIVLGIFSNTGSSGSNGDIGDVLNVYVSKVYDTIYSGELLKVKINSKLKNMDLVYFIHPQEGKIHIIANGADGVDGSNGINGGSGGNGGDGGTGGILNVFVSENASNYIPNIMLSNSGGKGGRGGKCEGALGSNGINGVNGQNGPVPRIEIVKNF